MINEPTSTSDGFQVLCIWCGEQIRNDKNEDSFGTCLQCFYRIVGDQLNSQRRTSSGSLNASDR